MDMKTSTGGAHIAAQKVVSPVNSHNEWDPLEEIMVGRLEGSVIPSSHPVVTPRDSMLVIGEEIIETPMAWPSRYFETHSYRPILKDYFRRGARWTSAPKPQLTDELFDPDFQLPEEGAPMRYILTEFEPVFDAADFFRCGRDLFVTRSNVTNASGTEWLRRHLGEGYRIHEIESRCPNPMHIDTTIFPLGPGKLLINPEYIDPDRLPDILKAWDILVAPCPLG